MSSFFVNEVKNQIQYQGALDVITQEELHSIACRFRELQKEKADLVQEKEKEIDELKAEIERLKNKPTDKTERPKKKYYTEEGREKGVQSHKANTKYFYQQIVNQINNGKKKKEIVGMYLESNVEKKNGQGKSKRKVTLSTYQRARVYGKEEGLIK